uniref:Uncharacterized protein n=1 Tax=Cucumis melo TaxID=3656 RepID=A0A9I9EBG8_CUCME
MWKEDEFWYDNRPIQSRDENRIKGTRGTRRNTLTRLEKMFMRNRKLKCTKFTVFMTYGFEKATWVLMGDRVPVPIYLAIAICRI